MRKASPNGWTIDCSLQSRSWRRPNASDRARTASSVVAVVVVLAGASDHDLVLLDRDDHGTVARPVLGVHGVVGDRRVEPEPVALLAVVERALELGRRAEAGEDEDESEDEDDEDEDEDEAPKPRRRGRRGGRGRRRAGASSELEGTFDHGEEGYGLWLDPAVADNAVYAEHWAGHRPVVVVIEEDQIVIRRAGEDDDGDD